MPENPLAVEIVLKNEKGEVVWQTSIPMPGRQESPKLSPGEYTLKFTPPENWTVTPPESTFVLAEKRNVIVVTIRVIQPGCAEIANSPKPQGEILFEEIMPIIAGAALTGSILLPSVFNFSPSIQPPQQARLSLENQNRNNLSPEERERVQQCIRENITSLLNIPEFSIPIQPFSEEETEQDDSIALFVELYEIDETVRGVVEDCNLTPLFGTMLNNEDETDSESEITIQSSDNLTEHQLSVMIVGEAVNVRTEPTPNSTVIHQLSYEVVQIDIQTLNNLPIQQRQAITMGDGWLPITLPDGQQGYVHSFYTSRIQNSN